MNAALRPRLLLAATLVFLAGLITFAPPGLCPCWLLADAQHLHPHPGGHPERPHSHGYLFDLSMSGMPAVAEPTLLPAATLILALALAARWRTVVQLALPYRPWAPPPQTPPPR
jgi:hypothetical protein